MLKPSLLISVWPRWGAGMNLVQRLSEQGPQTGTVIITWEFC